MRGESDCREAVLVRPKNERCEHFVGTATEQKVGIPDDASAELGAGCAHARAGKELDLADWTKVCRAIAAGTSWPHCTGTLARMLWPLAVSRL